MRIKPKHLLDPVAFAQAHGPNASTPGAADPNLQTSLSQIDDDFNSDSPTGQERQTVLRRFNTNLRKTQARSRRRRGHDVESAEQHSNLEDLLLTIEENAKKRERPRLMVTLRFDLDQGGAQQSAGQSPSREFGRRRMSDWADSPSKEAARKDIEEIVRSFLDSGAAQADGSTPAESSLAATARSLISLRDSKAHHGVDVPLTHAVLSIARQFLKSEHADTHMPKTLAGIRDLLVSICPKGVPQHALHNYHLKIPLILLNLRKPRSDKQRVAACSSISTLIKGMP